MDLIENEETQQLKQSMIHVENAIKDLKSRIIIMRQSYISSIVKLNGLEEYLTEYSIIMPYKKMKYTFPFYNTRYGIVKESGKMYVRGYSYIDRLGITLSDPYIRETITFDDVDGETVKKIMQVLKKFYNFIELKNHDTYEYIGDDGIAHENIEYIGIKNEN